MPYFSSNPSELKYPRKIADSHYYAEAKLNSNSIVQRSLDLLAIFGYQDSELRIIAK